MPSLHDLTLSILLAQDGGAPAGDGGRGGFFGEGIPFWVPLIIIGVMFYFMLIMPERRKRAAMTQMLENLKANDRVVTAGGILGTVVNASKESEFVTLRIDETNNTKLRIVRSSISRVVTGQESAEKGEKKEAG